MLYESFVHPLTILSTLPSALFGALLALHLCGYPFGLIAAIACVLLGMALQPAQRAEVLASLGSVVVVVVAARLHHGRSPV